LTSFKFFYHFYLSHEQEVTKQAQKLAKENDFVVRHYKFEAGKEDTRPARMVKIAAVQHAVSAPLTDPISEQKRKTFEKVGKIIDAAAAEGVNILCLQELWCKFFLKFSWT
jgi:beta-ureidopropionase